MYEGMQEVLQPGSRVSGDISPLALLTAGKHCSCVTTTVITIKIRVRTILIMTVVTIIIMTIMKHQ